MATCSVSQITSWTFSCFGPQVGSFLDYLILKKPKQTKTQNWSSTSKCGKSFSSFQRGPSNDWFSVKTRARYINLTFTLKGIPQYVSPIPRNTQKFHWNGWLLSFLEAYLPSSNLKHFTLQFCRYIVAILHLNKNFKVIPDCPLF